MRAFIAVLLLASALVPASVGAQGPSKETLAQFRAKYLGQRVLIHHAHASGGQLLGWEPAKQVRGRYETDIGYQVGAFINAEYATQQPTVIVVQLAKTLEDSANGREPTSENALGESIDPENPYVDVIIRFDDGKVAKITNFVAELDDEDSDIELVSVRDAHADYLGKALPEAVGGALYAIGDSKVYPPESTLKELTDITSFELPLSKVPNLQPLRIIDARYNGEVDRVILKLQLPDGRFGIVATPYDESRGSTILSRIARGFLVQIPTDLTAREIAAIQEHKIFRGMSRRAVTLSWGSPGKVNDWGGGGKQLVYDDGHQLVYIDTNGVVTDWQSFE